MTTKEFLSKVEEKVLISRESGSKDANVKIPTDFTKEEMKEIMQGAKNFLHQNLSYAKAHPKVAIELVYSDFYLVLRWDCWN